MTANSKAPDVVSLEHLTSYAEAALCTWINDPKNRRIVPKLLEKIGNMRVANPTADGSRWNISGKRQTVYGHKDLTSKERIDAVDTLQTSGSRGHEQA